MALKYKAPAGQFACARRPTARRRPPKSWPRLTASRTESFFRLPRALPPARGLSLQKFLSQLSGEQSNIDLTERTRSEGSQKLLRPPAQSLS